MSTFDTSFRAWQLSQRLEEISGPPRRSMTLAEIEGELPLSQDTPQYRNAFWDYVTSRSPTFVARSEHRALSKATDSAGGYLVPTEWARCRSLG